MTKETDNELIRRALASDQKAFSRLLTRYYDKVFFYIVNIVKNKHDAHDLAMEVFNKVFQNLNTYNEQYAFSTWLYKIAHNRAIDFIRRRKNNTIPIDYGSDEDTTINENTLSSELPNPEECLINRQEQMLLMKHINSMKPKYRRLIKLRYINEYGYEEIAKKLNLPLGTVKTQLFRAKSILTTMITGNHT